VNRSKVLAAIAILLAAITVGAFGSGGAQAQDSGAGGGNDVLRIGWSQDPKTLNPFVGVNEEEFLIWAINWELLVGFSPENLSPAPAIAESWEVSEDGRTYTYHLIEDATWSDGEPITSADVKFSLETLGENGLLFTGYTDGVTAIRTPDEYTVVLETKQPNARLIGDLFVYILPEHIWGKVPVDELTGGYQPEIPLVGSGPYIVTEFERGRILHMEPNPEWRGEAPSFDELQFIRYGSADAVERALTLGEVDFIPEVQPATFNRLSEQEGIETVNAPTYSFTELAFNLCSEEHCPEAKFNPAVQDNTIRQAIAYSIDRERNNEIANQGTSFPAHGLLPSFYKDFYEVPEQDYPYDPALANQLLDEAGWVLNDDGIREKDGMVASFDLFVRSEAPADIQYAKLIAEQTQEIGVEFNVQVVSTDKLTELTVRKVDGLPAPEFDTFIWGWGGDPYDPSALLDLLTTSQIGGSSDAFYSNPEYDRLFKEQLTLVGDENAEERQAVVKEMVAILQEDLPYIVLTYDPYLEAYNSDALSNVERLCPAETGEILCQQVSYEPLLTLEPGAGSSSGDTTSGVPGGVAALGAVIVAIAAFVVGRARGRREVEPLELEA
jgi:peptide/nickel transport system substrate-binding protein